MSLKETTKGLKELLQQITHDLEKAEGGNKAASQRVRTGTVRLEKLAKGYRKESITSEKSGHTKKAHKSPSKAAGKSKTAAKGSHVGVSKSKTAAKKPAAKASSTARPLAVKRPAVKTAARRTNA